MSGRSPPLYCTFTLLVTMQGEQKNSKIKQRQCSTPSHMVVIIYHYMGYKYEATTWYLTGFHNGFVAPGNVVRIWCLLRAQLPPMASISTAIGSVHRARPSDQSTEHGHRIGPPSLSGHKARSPQHYCIDSSCEKVRFFQLICVSLFPNPLFF